MATKTKIQWCDSTINPIMGCGGCELYPSSSEIFRRLDQVLSDFGNWRVGQSKNLYKKLVENAYAKIQHPLPGHSHALSATNLWHLRREFLAEVSANFSRESVQAADQVIGGMITCYAARLHLSKARSIANPERGANSGYAPTFEVITRFSGRIREAAKLSDLRGRRRTDKPWLDGLPRHIFVSDMGDAFSRKADFQFLEEEIQSIVSPQGARHIWLWLTKRPERMARFGEEIGGFPSNVVAMTTLTGPDTLGRVDALRCVSTVKRGLSIEPLRDRIPPEKMNLEGIDWVIVGGESGRYDCVHPFQLEWARELRDYCQSKGVAFFLKQLGRRPFEGNTPLYLADKHGGDWSEWPEDLRVRQMFSLLQEPTKMSAENQAQPGGIVW